MIQSDGHAQMPQLEDIDTRKQNIQFNVNSALDDDQPNPQHHFKTQRNHYMAGRPGPANTIE